MRYLFVVMLLFILFNFSKTDIYIDNGLSQTILEEDLTKSEKLHIQMEILNILGLPHKPKKTKKSLQKSTLRYLLNVYNSLTNENIPTYGRSKRSVALEVNEKELNAIEESDMIITFDNTYQHFQFKHNKGERFFFNVSEIPVAENILDAELRVFQKGIKSKNNKKVIFTIKVYEFTDAKQKHKRLISSVNTTRSYTGWLNFNITSCLISWVAFPRSNHGLYISVHLFGKLEHEISSRTIGLTTMKRYGETLPFMVVFTKNINHVNPKRVVREVRSTNNKKSHKSKYSTVMKTAQYETWNTICRIHSLYIDFKDLNWQDWIIAPQAYSAYYCAGECKFPLTAQMNATSHAIVQSWVHFMYPHKFPKPLCAPTEVIPMYLLYQHDNSAALKKKKDMIVKSCGCL